MNILILEDEIPAYQKLLTFIHTEIADGKVVGWARSIEEAALFFSKKPQLDLIISDIELLDGISFELFEKTKVDCPIIFCTGFDQYVLRAFKTNGIAYLLKPYSLENFREAYEKYKTLFAKKETKPIDENILKELQEILHSDKKSYKQRFTVKKKDGIKLLDTKDIGAFEANGDFCMAIDREGKKHALNSTLSEVEEKIDPTRFFRINRSQIINVDFLEKVEPYFKNRLAIKMKFTKEIVYTSSNKTPSFRKWLEG
ncbi:MAG: LytTR family DNA-binding domain-containing protein [Bacteroidota bacterium]